ncbi:DUF465 domain-containing protein [Altererythrobacter sp. KTW20L]|jgi:hypothetical protein|uniref:DUF465 domain-containing protein n=1 Tax=Altererythrobacter sp. KTW20L TaxID=2942210 RepID=UPI0020BF9F2F|nr:DUF465 domain-containing protein [Altererythrobacter sp. KTW20L]MCL6250109.1 DUF465 domain-containing protein [Altererythrobacter sp. KTW20L]
MTARLFRLTQMHQRIDERLRLAAARRSVEAWELARLAALRARVKALIRQNVPQSFLA